MSLLLFVCVSKGEKSGSIAAEPAKDQQLSLEISSVLDLSNMASLLSQKYGVEVSEDTLKNVAGESLVPGRGFLQGREVRITPMEESATLISAITEHDHTVAAAHSGALSTSAAHQTTLQEALRATGSTSTARNLHQVTGMEPSALSTSTAQTAMPQRVGGATGLSTSPAPNMASAASDGGAKKHVGPCAAGQYCKMDAVACDGN